MPAGTDAEYGSSPVTTSSVAAIFASSAGFLKGAAIVSCPSIMLLVAAPSAATVVQHSSLGEAGLSYLPSRWSLTQREWHPSSSPMRALVFNVSYLLSSGPRNTPKSTPFMGTMMSTLKKIVTRLSYPEAR